MQSVAIIREPMAGAVALSVCALLLSGCATRAPMDFSCPSDGNEPLIAPVPPPAIVGDIVQPTGDPGEAAGQSIDRCPAALKGQSPFLDALCATKQAPPRNEPAEAASEPAGLNYLLLSGGGPWGAFGAGFLSELERERAYPEPILITGVSTGALQALFLAAPPAKRRARMDELVAAYSIRSESEIVNRNGQLAALLTGSMAGTAPLRGRIERSLCTEGRPELGCPGIQAIAEYGGYGAALVGFVYADTGQLMAANLVRMAKLATEWTEEEQNLGTTARDEAVSSRRRALNCLTGAAMASSAIPGQLQQVRINGRTAMDGGVRASVFEGQAIVAASIFARSAAAAKGAAALSDESATAAFWIVRNGPTSVSISGQESDLQKVPANDPLNGSLSILAMAGRAQGIIVNQTEVSSIALVRLGNPEEKLSLVTADGAAKFSPDCIRPEKVMFGPNFMECLVRYGAYKADMDPPWTIIRPIDLAKGGNLGGN